MKYYVLVHEAGSRHGEFGFIYRSAITDIILPIGFVAVADDTRTYEHIEVIKESDMLEIDAGTYERIKVAHENGDDVVDEVLKLIEQRTKKIHELKTKRELLVNSAIELLDAWQQADEVTADLADMNTKYPFPTCFAEMVAEMQAWGYEDKD